MDDEADRRARLRARLEREASAPAEAARVPGRTTLVEQLSSSPPMATRGIPGKTTRVEQRHNATHAEQVSGLISQARQALAGAGDHERAYEALVDALASHAGAVLREHATEMMSLCIDLLCRRNAPQPTDIAARGVASASAQLPFHDEVQASFGRHDISGIRAQVGGPAAAATSALGARAYAAGNRVAFAGAPDLHTAAHEAAHVVQQRAGVSLKGLDGGGSDPYEQHADAVADAVVAGQSAVPLLDRMPASAGGGTVVQRKSADAASSSSATGAADVDEETLPDNVQDFAIAPDGWSALVRTAWVTRDLTENLLKVLRQMQRLGAFTWAKEDGLRRAAAQTPKIDRANKVVRYRITLRTLAQMGLPPLSGAMVAHEGEDLVIAVKVPGVKDDDQKESHPLSLSDAQMVYHAVETFTGLAMKSHPHLDGLVIRDGIMEVHIGDKQAAEMFGAKSWSDWKKNRAGAKDTGAPQDKPADVSSELSFAEKVHVESWLKENLGLVDSGPVTHIDRSTLNVIDEIEKNPDLKPLIKQLIERKTTAPGRVAGTFALEELLEAAKTERDRHRLGTDKLDQGDTTPLDPGAKVWDIEGHIVQKGLVFADREMTFKLELDWQQWKMGRSAEDIDQFAKRGWHAEIEWAVERTDKPDKPEAFKQSYDESNNVTLGHTFKLGAGEKSGQFKVHAFMRSTHFSPKHFTAQIEVKTEEARMQELRAQDLGDMMDAGTMMMNYTFDIGTGQKVLGPIAGSSRDTHGYAISGALPKDFQHADPQQRKQGRADELELQKKLVAYLVKQSKDGKPGYGDAIKAAEQRIKFLEETEKKLAGDEKSGWTPFEVRGTYLSRNGEVSSGGLDLYGNYKYSMSLGQPAKFEVMIRDLSNKLESDLEFSGDGEHFDDALREAFVKLAKAYPDGKVSVLAEDIALDGLQGKPNGRSIGYELATTSAWQRVKSKVYDPVVQVLTNAAAMAVMIIFPPSAAVIVPMLAVADIVNNVDDMVSKHDKGTLTLKSASIDLLQIGLDVLPAARGAKFLNPAQSAIQEAKGAANMRLVLFDVVQFGGQFIVMYERTKEQLVEIQDKQISVLAEKYRALIELQTQVAEGKLNSSDPQLKQRQADIEADAKAIRDTVTTTWTQAVQHQATFFVGSHLVGGHEEAAAGAKANEDTHFEREIPREVTTLRKTAANTFEGEPQNLRVAHAHYQAEGVQTSAIEYDHATDTAHFDITDKTTGTKTRIEAPMRSVRSFGDLHGASNKVVGHPIDKTTGFAVIEKLNRGDASALTSVGIGDAPGGTLPVNYEFGLGELANGEVVVVIGEPAAVDWAHLPGMTPRAHTHPPTVQDIPPQQDGTRSIPLTELVQPKPDPYLPREVVFPTGADFIVMAHQGVDGHVVVTAFVLRDGKVMKAPEGDTGPRLIFTILGSHEIGARPDGHKVYKAKVVGKSGSETPINHDVWIVAELDDTNGGIFMTQPADVVLNEPGKAAPHTEFTNSGEHAAEQGPATKTEARRPLSPGDVKRKQALMKKWRNLGITELRELVRLRERAGETTYEKDTPEHKVAAWENTDSDKTFEKWSPVYHRNINNNKDGLGREADFRARLDNGNGKVTSKVVQTARGARQMDASIPIRYFQLKSGDQDLTRKRHGGQLPNLEAILRDRLADKPVVWVIEGKASQPLRDMLQGIDPPETKIEGPQGPKTPLELFEGEGAFEAAIKKYGLPPKKEDQ